MTETSVSTRDETGELAAPAASGRAVVRYNPDAPSEAWGWHGSWREFAPRGSRILLWAGVALVALSILSVHESRVEDYWVGAISLLGAAWLISREVSGRRLRRRRATEISATSATSAKDL